MLRSVFIVLFAMCVCEAHHISIDIEPEEMQRIAEILVENYMVHNLTPRPRIGTIALVSKIKKIALGVVQLIGITLSLVSANLITSKFERIASPMTINNDNITAAIVEPMDICDRDFGCNRNVCWRACDSGTDYEKGDSHSWCFTTPDPETHNYQQCIYPHDCSPCWECLGSCHSKKTLKWFV